MEKTIAQQLGVTDFPFEIRDRDNRVIYFEDSNKFWYNLGYYENYKGKVIDRRRSPKEIITLNGVKYKRVNE